MTWGKTSTATGGHSRYPLPGVYRTPWIEVNGRENRPKCWTGCWESDFALAIV